MLKLKLPYFGHLMRRADSLEKTPDAGKCWRQEEKGTTEDEMVGWHHQLSEHEFEQTPGDGEGQDCLLQSMGFQRIGHDLVTEQRQTESDSRSWQSPFTLQNKEMPGRKLNWKGIWWYSLHWKVKSLSCVWLVVTPWTAAHQAPPSMGFSRQEDWSGVPSPSPASTGATPKTLPVFVWKGDLTHKLRNKIWILRHVLSGWVWEKLISLRKHKVNLSLITYKSKTFWPTLFFSASGS